MVERTIEDYREACTNFSDWSLYGLAMAYTDLYIMAYNAKDDGDLDLTDEALWYQSAIYDYCMKSYDPAEFVRAL